MHTHTHSLSMQAIRDGVIEATIDHEQGFMRSKVNPPYRSAYNSVITSKQHFNIFLLLFLQENIDIYATKEPQEAFHQRVLFCLDLYTQSVKVLKLLYPQYI